MLGQVDADRPAGDRDEPGKARLELMLSLLSESETLVPRDCAGGVLDTKHGHDLLLHRVEANECQTARADLR